MLHVTGRGNMARAEHSRTWPFMAVRSRVHSRAYPYIDVHNRA